MKPHLFIVLTTLMLAACAAIGSQPPAGQPAEYRGTYDRVCSPIDASGIEFRLEKISGAGPALVFIQVWAPLHEAEQDVIALTGEAKQGSLTACHSEQDCQQMQHGFLIVNSWNGRYPESGQFWSSNGQVHGNFSALPGQADPPICG